MFDPVISDLNRHLSSLEAREAAFEACADEREQLEQLQARQRELEGMDYANWTAAMNDELAANYEAQTRLRTFLEKMGCY